MRFAGAWSRASMLTHCTDSSTVPQPQIPFAALNRNDAEATVEETVRDKTTEAEVWFFPIVRTRFEWNAVRTMYPHAKSQCRAHVEYIGHTLQQAELSLALQHQTWTAGSGQHDAVPRGAVAAERG